MTSMIDRRRCLSAMTGAGIASLAGCLSSALNDDEDARPALSDRTFRYGAVLPLTGELSFIADPLQNATALPVTELEASGLDLSFEYEVADSRTTPGGAVDAATTLIDEEYPAIIGAAASDATLQMTQQATIPAEVVSCSPSSTSPTMSILNDRGYSFRTAPDDSMQAVVAAQLASTEHDAETAATIYTAGDYGRQLSGAFSASFRGDIQRQVSFTPGSESYAEPLSQALADDPDILFVISYVESGIELLQEYYGDHRGDETVFISDGLQDESLPNEVSEVVDNVFGTAPTSTGPGQDRFATLYRDEYGDEPALFTANCYDATATVLLANAAAGENDGTAIRGEMNNVTSGDGVEVLPGELAEGIKIAATGAPVRYRGASGEIEFDVNGDGGSITYEYFTYDSGGIAVIDERTPEGAAE
ncbi:ABC transporter substrate-binding protein [Natronorubrum sp. JWXQ-INN-674]|uniref:ABC transporter substrate-binding protein n=1 Tax=Natronorubrum halalkaliphilum TaxID=2691917 RepID=A0A6B0VP04_9EURY|nr:ABC transporter substrate-binding protein [Natronorubrum halalkaliphilum]MXV63551.1 ABC transporter substrate-binding protein [Natronorubrum halalkaliphilum]